MLRGYLREMNIPSLGETNLLSPVGIRKDATIIATLSFMSGFIHEDI